MRHLGFVGFLIGMPDLAGSKAPGCLSRSVPRSARAMAPDAALVAFLDSGFVIASFGVGAVSAFAIPRDGYAAVYAATFGCDIPGCGGSEG